MGIYSHHDYLYRMSEDFKDKSMVKLLKYYIFGESVQDTDSFKFISSDVLYNQDYDVVGIIHYNRSSTASGRFTNKRIRICDIPLREITYNTNELLAKLNNNQLTANVYRNKYSVYQFFQASGTAIKIYRVHNANKTGIKDITFINDIMIQSNNSVYVPDFDTITNMQIIVSSKNTLEIEFTDDIDSDYYVIETNKCVSVSPEGNVTYFGSYYHHYAYSEIDIPIADAKDILTGDKIYHIDLKSILEPEYVDTHYISPYQLRLVSNTSIVTVHGNISANLGDSLIRVNNIENIGDELKITDTTVAAKLAYYISKNNLMSTVRSNTNLRVRITYYLDIFDDGVMNLKFSKTMNEYMDEKNFNRDIEKPDYDTQNIHEYFPFGYNDELAKYCDTPVRRIETIKGSNIYYSMDDTYFKQEGENVYCVRYDIPIKQSSILIFNKSRLIVPLYSKTENFTMSIFVSMKDMFTEENYESIISNISPDAIYQLDYPLYMVCYTTPFREDVRFKLHMEYEYVPVSSAVKYSKHDFGEVYYNIPDTDEYVLPKTYKERMETEELPETFYYRLKDGRYVADVDLTDNDEIDSREYIEDEDGMYIKSPITRLYCTYDTNLYIKDIVNVDFQGEQRSAYKYNVWDGNNPEYDPDILYYRLNTNTYILPANKDLDINNISIVLEDPNVFEPDEVKYILNPEGDYVYRDDEYIIPTEYHIGELRYNRIGYKHLPLIEILNYSIDEIPGDVGIMI